MKVIMNITGIEGEVAVIIPNNIAFFDNRDSVFHATSKEEAEKMAIEKVCMIKENDIDIIAII